MVLCLMPVLQPRPVVLAVAARAGVAAGLPCFTQGLVQTVAVQGVGVAMAAHNRRQDQGRH